MRFVKPSLKRKAYRLTTRLASTFVVALVVSIFCIAGIDSAIAKEGLHTQSKSSTFGLKTCSSGYGELKRRMKIVARRHCSSVHHSGKVNTLRQENFTKLSCEKKKEGTKTVSVNVKGTLTYLCS